MNSALAANDYAHIENELTWSTKQLARSKAERSKVIILLLIIDISCCSIFTISFWGTIEKDFTGYLEMLITVNTLIIAMLIGMRQKTEYHYVISAAAGVISYRLYYPVWTPLLVKTGAAVAACLLLVIGLWSGLVTVVVGPGAVVLAAALRLGLWENLITTRQSLPWHMYNHVTVDRKQRFIVTHVADPTLGFEARLPDDETFETYLAFLRRVLPRHATFTEKRWELSMI